MQKRFFQIAFFFTAILIGSQCGSIAPSIGSGSYYIQAGFVSLTPTQIGDFQASNFLVTKNHNVSLRYIMTTYSLSIGFMKVNWHFDTDVSIKNVQAVPTTKTSDNFVISLTSTFGSTLFDLKVSYLAVDSSLNSYIYTFSSGVLISPSGFGTWPANYTANQSYPLRAWSGYKSTTKVLIYCSYYQYNPALSTANNSLGIYTKLNTVSTSTFQINLVIPFGQDVYTKYYLNVVYFNPVELKADKLIILNTAFLSTGDKLTVKTLNNASFYTNTYTIGQGCNMADNNTFIALQPYLAFSTQMNFQFSLSGNSVFAAAQNYYALNFSVIHFCSKICSTSTNPFLYKVDNMCYDVCPDGYQANIMTNICEIVQMNCSTWQSAQTNCTSCFNGSFLFDNICRTLCPSAMYGDFLVNQCLNCNGSCLNCQGEASNCTSCLVNFFLYNFDCLLQCPLGYYGDNSTAICQVCSSYCLNCSSLSICLTCSNESLLYNYSCILSCPSTTYVNPLLNQCLDCKPNCLQCSLKSTNCTDCIDNTFYLNYRCYYDCPVGYYENPTTQNCQKCFTNCFSCINFITCTKCMSQYFASPDIIYNPYSNECLECNGTCYNCDYESTNCTSCINNTFLLNFDCLYNCPAGYYGNTSTGNCQTCFLNCATCTAVNVCTLCKSNQCLWPTLDKCDDSCPPNYFPNFTTGLCQRIIIWGCVSALYLKLKGDSICLQCDVSQYFKYVPSNKSCVCKDGYKLNNGTCQEYCGDGIVNNMPCDDGNLMNGDGCSFQCLIESNFNCFSVPNGPTLKSKCSYLPEINIQILSETKVNNQNTLKLILKIYPTPIYLSSNQIKQFLNLKIEDDVINMNKLQIIYKDGIAQIYIPFTASIQNKELSLSTNFDPTKFSSSNILISSILKGDNVALLYSSDLTLYKALGTINFSMAIFVCIFALLSSYKHKMIGLELIMPFQVILYSQSFYNLEALQTTVYTSLKPVSFSVFTPDQIGSKNNAWYKIGMTGGFLQNYNLLGLLFLISTIFFIVSIFKLKKGQRKRFKLNKSIKNLLNFRQFKIILIQYESIVWKYYFVSFCLSTIPFIFSVSVKVMTVQTYSYSQEKLDVINNKINYLFYLMFIGALFYTSIPKTFYNSQKSFLNKSIFKREGEKFKYDASYCMYFQLHYFFIGFIYAYCPPTLPFFYTISSINGLFFLYLILKRPYESALDNIGAILSNIIIVYFLSFNLYIKIEETSSLISFLSKISSFVITFLFFINCIVSIVRLKIFWKYDREQSLDGLKKDLQADDKFEYKKDQAFNKFVKGTAKEQEVQFNNMMNRIQGQMLLNHPKTINQQLISKIQKGNKNEKVNKRKSTIDINQPQSKVQKVPQQNFSSLKRIKNNLRQSYNNYKIEQQQRQKEYRNKNGFNNLNR